VPSYGELYLECLRSTLQVKYDMSPINIAQLTFVRVVLRLLLAVLVFTPILVALSSPAEHCVLFPISTPIRHGGVKYQCSSKRSGGACVQCKCGRRSWWEFPGSNRENSLA
jgi:hypothetical protein